MKMNLMMFTVLSVFCVQVAHAGEVDITSSNPFEKEFVRISESSDSSGGSLYNFELCDGTPTAAGACETFTKRSSYSLTDLETRKQFLRKKEMKAGALDAAVVIAGVATGGLGLVGIGLTTAGWASWSAFALVTTVVAVPVGTTSPSTPFFWTLNLHIYRLNV